MSRDLDAYVESSSSIRIQQADQPYLPCDLDEQQNLRLSSSIFPLSNKKQLQNPQSSIFTIFQQSAQQLRTRQYQISILTSNIQYLQKSYAKRHSQFKLQQQGMSKLKKMNNKTSQAVSAQVHNIKVMRKSYKQMDKQVKQLQLKVKGAFNQRLDSQTRKNELHEQYKVLEEEYMNKIEQLQSFFATKSLSNVQFYKQASQSRSLNTTYDNIPPQSVLQSIKHNGQIQLPALISQKQGQISSLQSSLQLGLSKRQQIKSNIKQITQHIKKYEQEQFNLQVRIQNIQKQKNILTIYENQVIDKNQQINILFSGINQIKQELDNKCEEKYDLLNYFKQIQKEQKNMRKIRKIKAQCQKEQNKYKEQKKNQQFLILQSEHDQEYIQSPQKQYVNVKYSQKDVNQAFTNNNQEQDQQSARFDKESNQKILSLVERYERLKSRRRV